jgi:hypothetical protein
MIDCDLMKQRFYNYFGQHPKRLIGWLIDT